MAMVTMWKLLVVVMAMAFVAQSGSAQPVSRTAPYSVTINAGANAVPVTVIATQNYIVSLEGNPCAITIRHLFANTVAHLFWTANYYVGSLATATKCTLKFTSTGDLQLFALFKGTDTMIWHSDTAGKGIVKMALENSFDSGDLQLLTATNVIKYQSFDVKEFSILPTQKFKCVSSGLVSGYGHRRAFTSVSPELLCTRMPIYPECSTSDAAGMERL